MVSCTKCWLELRKVRICHGFSTLEVISDIEKCDGREKELDPRRREHFSRFTIKKGREISIGWREGVRSRECYFVCVCICLI